MSQNLSSAAVLVMALRVKIQNLQTIKSQTYFAKIKYNKQGLLFVPTSYRNYILTSIEGLSRHVQNYRLV